MHNSFTLIIPAAGKGSRLGHSHPKILYPIAKTTPLEILLKRFGPYVNRTLLIVSPSGKPAIETKLNGDPGVSLVTQETPTGMVDAILKASPSLSEDENVIIVWGDQVLLSDKTVQTAIQLFFSQNSSIPHAVLPLVKTQKPYVHFDRNSLGEITRCRLRRENDSMPENGDSDCGLFLLKGKLIKDSLETFAHLRNQKGKITGEVSFPPFFPYLQAKGIPVFTSLVENAEEAIGLNDRNDLAQIEKVLR